MKKKWDTYIYGDVNIDLVVPGVEELPAPGTEVDVETMETFVGGGAALFALGVAKLGLTPAFQGSVGRDMYGRYIRNLFRETGVDDALLADRDDTNTGISISFTNERDRCFLTYRGNNAGLSLRHMDLEKVKQARHVHVTGYEGTSNHEEYLGVLRKIKGSGDTTVSFDVGWDMTGAWYEGIFELLPYIDVLFMNETECLHYTRCEDVESGAVKLAEKAGMAVIKLGKKGALAVKDGKICKAPAYDFKVVDTTGAGDSFNAGFVSAFLEGLTVEDCLRWGNCCGSFSVTRLGGNTGFPTRKELEAFLADH
ncbi:MAG: carbohydrate kinase family protein [Clostridia bacterium]|nr:carbohydrate kinase family protein [Clostridia bacterium]